jgi:threonyl-tRNA synthetase
VITPRSSILSSRHVPLLFRRSCGSDHRELAHSQKLLTNSIYSPGSPLFLPNGADMMNKLAGCLRAHYPQFGFREVITPTIYKRSLWEKSGHWENYADDMFEVRGRGASGKTKDAQIGEDEEFGLKAMNCPGHCLQFSSERRSYRDMPVRFADFSPLHRNEISGALSGLTRVRRFHQDDGHIFCRPSQIESEIARTMEFIQLVYKDIFGLGEYRLVLSTRPEKFIGQVAEWNKAEDQLKTALDSTGRDWALSEGDGSFYGPKIDIILKDSDGKEHQTATIQLDFQLPKNFGLEYDVPADEATSQSKEGSTATPVLIHRAVLGSLERFLALLIEHYNGKYPLWISPNPVTILSVSQSAEELSYIDSVAAELGGHPFGKAARKVPTQRPSLHIEKDTSARPLGKKIREAKAKGFNFIIVIGPKDANQKTLSLETSNQHDQEKALAALAHVAGTTDVGVKYVTNPRTVRAFFENLQDEYL